MNTALCSGKKKPRSDRVFADHAGEFMFRNAVRNIGPSGPVIGGLENHRRVVVILIAGSDQISGSGRVRGNLDRIDHHLAQPSRGDVLPGGAAIAGDVYQAVIAANIKNASIMG